MFGKIKEALYNSLGADTMSYLVCTRVWEAWHYNTMTKDDFTEIATDEDLLNELSESVMKELLVVGTYGVFYDNPEDKHIKFGTLLSIREEEYRFQSEDLAFWKCFEPLSETSYRKMKEYGR